MDRWTLALVGLLLVAVPVSGQIPDTRKVITAPDGSLDAAVVPAADTTGALQVKCVDATCAGGGTTDTDDGTVAGGQSAGLQIGLTYVWNGSAWQRMIAAALADDTANPTVVRFGAFTHVWDGGFWDRWTGAVSATDLDIRDLSSATDSVLTVLSQTGTANDVDVVSFPDNEPINVAQFGGSAVASGIGAAGAGVPRVTLSNDNVEGTVSFTSGAACPAASETAVTTSAGCIVVPLAGMSGVGFELQAGTLTATVVFETSADDGATWTTGVFFSGGVQDGDGSRTFTNPNAKMAVEPIMGSSTTHARLRVSAFTSGSAVVFGRATEYISSVSLGTLTITIPSLGMPIWANMGGFRAATTTPTAVTSGAAAFATGDVYGVPYTRQDHPARINCVITSTATTSTLVTGCGAPGAGLSIYVTDITYSSSIVSSTTNVPTLQYGTGGACGTGTTVFWRGFMAAFTTIVVDLSTPIKIPNNNEVCFLHAGAGTRQVSVTGFIAP